MIRTGRTVPAAPVDHRAHERCAHGGQIRAHRDGGLLQHRVGLVDVTPATGTDGTAPLTDGQPAPLGPRRSVVRSELTTMSRLPIAVRHGPSPRRYWSSSTITGSPFDADASGRGPLPQP